MLSPASWTGNKSRGHLEYSAWYWPMLSLHVKSTTWKISVGLSELPVCSSLPWLVINWHPFVRVRIFKGNHADLWLRGSWLRCYSHVDVFVLRFVLFVSVCICMFVLPCCMACRILVSQPGIEPGPQQWKCWLPGKIIKKTDKQLKWTALSNHSGHLRISCETWSQAFENTVWFKV